MIKKVLLGTLLLVVVCVVAGGLFLYTAVNADVDEHFAGTCTDLPLAGSGEDIQIDRERGFAYLSQLDRMGVAKKEAIDPGMIMRVDLNQDELAAVPALLDGPELHPHGISLFIGNDGQRTLFLINHPADRENGQEMIERYVETSPGNFSHRESFSSELITRGNDLVAVGERQFYVAQDVARTGGETVTKLVYFDGENFMSVADDIASGGGINVSADLQTLYISETGDKRIRIASRDAHGGIKTVREIQLETSPDNIDVAADGSLWVGAHSNIVALAMHFIAGSKAPTQILRVDLSKSEPQVSEIYLNAGDQISAGSGGATIGKRLLAGSITARKILVCEMD